MILAMTGLLCKIIIGIKIQIESYVPFEMALTLDPSLETVFLHPVCSLRPGVLQLYIKSTNIHSAFFLPGPRPRLSGSVDGPFTSQIF